jgi:hypothetical protein
MLTDYVLAGAAMFFAVAVRGSLPTDLEAVLWRVTLTLIATGCALFVAAGLKSGIRRDEPAIRWLLAGILVTLVGFAVLRARLTLHTHFNHNDLYHLIQGAGLYLLYKGVVLVGPSPPPKSFGLERSPR